MNKRKTKYIALIISIAVSMTLSSFAQDRECDVYISNNANGNGISVRWIGKKIIYQEGVNIYRKQKGSDWIQLTKKPIMPAQNLKPGLNLAEKSQQMFDLYQSQSIGEFVDGFAAVFSVIESIKDYNLALALNIAYNDETAVIGSIYQYKIETKINGEKTVLGITDELKCDDFEMPSPPDSIKIERTKKGIEFRWKNNIEKYYFYDVYEKVVDSEWKLVEDKIASTAIVKSKGPTYFRKASPDTAYSYKICGYDYFGNKSKMSEEFVMNIQDFEPPIIPELKSYVDSKKMAVNLSWTKDNNDDLSHYNIYRSKDPEKFTLHSVIKTKIPKEDTSYIDYPERAGSYYYIIEAVDLSGNTSRSLFVNGTVFDIRAPYAPKNLIAKVDTGKLMLSWDVNTASDLKGYRLYRSVADDNNEDNKFVVVNSELIDTNFYTEPMSENVRSKFAYHVRAVDSSYNVSLQSNIVLAQLPDVTPPVAPFIKKVSEIDKNLIIEWMPNVETDLLGYHLYKKAKDDTLGFQKVNISIIPKNVSFYKDIEAERGQFYEYYLVAIDESNLVSKQSNFILGKLEFLPLAGNLIIKKAKVSIITKELTIEWLTDSIINEPIIGFSIHKSINGGKYKQMGAVLTTNVYKEKLSESGIYEYEIRIYGERGNMLKSEIIKIEFEN